MTISFFVAGKAAPGGSKSGFYNKKLGRVMMTPASKKTKPWMNTVTAVAGEHYRGKLIDCPVCLTMEFRMLRPKGHYCKSGLSKKGRETPYPTVKPDLTKLIRSTEDALTGVIWRDDTCVCKQQTSKVYVDRDPGVFIEVKPLV